MVSRPSLCQVAALVCVLLCGNGRAQHRADLPSAPEAGAGALSGTVTDADGDLLPNARIEVVAGGLSFNDIADGDGRFHISGLPPGAYDMHVVADGFEAVDERGTLDSAEQRELPVIELRPSSTQSVGVVATQQDIATEQVKEEMTQRIMGFIPNFYVVYHPNPAPLTSGQKFHLAWRSLLDPITFAGTAFISGIDQETGGFSGFGQDYKGYAQRFGANFADNAVGTFLEGYVLPSVLHQDPRYFYQGTGSVMSRAKHALLSVVICRGDNGKQQFNASSILGALAAGGVSNLYYPASDRHGVSATFSGLGTGVASSAFSAIMQEFVVPRLTPHRPGKVAPAPKATGGF